MPNKGTPPNKGAPYGLETTTTDHSTKTGLNFLNNCKNLSYLAILASSS